jgi:hypothetical protein
MFWSRVEVRGGRLTHRFAIRPITPRGRHDKLGILSDGWDQEAAVAKLDATYRRDIARTITVTSKNATQVIPSQTLNADGQKPASENPPFGIYAPRIQEASLAAFPRASSGVQTWSPSK